MDAGRISVVIPSYRSRDTIGQTLESVQRQRQIVPLEVLVVDSSGDRMGEWISQHYPRVKVISSPVQLWPGAARNRGAQLARGSLLAFLDADAAPAPHWLVTLVGKMEEDSKIRMIGAAVAHPAAVTVAQRLLHWIEFSEFLPELSSGWRPYLPSCNLLVRRDDFQQWGGFSEAFAMCEDLILCAALEGGKYFEASTSVVHRRKGRWPATRAHLRALGYWSGFYRKTYLARGAWLAAFPLASAGLPFLRWWKILGRVFRSSLVNGLTLLTLSPLLWLGLVHWTLGFYRGLRSDRPE